jgi:AcrR family transcriptional regulator
MMQPRPPASDPPGVATTAPSGGHDAVGRRLLAAAHRVLADEGPSALTVRRLAAVSGVSTMNVYSRFGGKDGVVDELFSDGFRRLTELMSHSPTTDDPIADLRACGDRYRQFALENPTYYAVMFDKVFPDYTPSDRAQAMAIESLGRLAASVQRAIDAGLLTADDAWLVAAGLWASCHGLVSLELRRYDLSEKVPGGPGELSAAADWDLVYAATLDHLVAGYLR